MATPKGPYRPFGCCCLAAGLAYGPDEGIPVFSNPAAHKKGVSEALVMRKHFVRLC